MSQHKTGNSTFDKKAYWKRRNQGERGVETPVLVKPVDYSKEINEKTGQPKYLTHFGPNRRMRRQRVIDRSATKKGMTGIVHIDENRQARQLFAPKGSRPDNMAMHSKQRMQKASARGE
jgi:hypothetical protein